MAEVGIIYLTSHKNIWIDGMANAIWASEALYIPGNSDEQFINILSHNLRPIYETAHLQGYDMWKIDVE